MGSGAMSTAHREILAAALATIASRTPIAPNVPRPDELEAWPYDREPGMLPRREWAFAEAMAASALAASEALLGSADDILTAVRSFADGYTHEDVDAGGTMSSRYGYVDGHFYVASYCANVARRALRACGLETKPDTYDAARVEAFAAKVEAKVRVLNAAHATVGGGG